MPGLRQLLRVMRHRDFRLLWSGQAASVVGDGIVVVALALFVVDLTGSATDLGFVLGAYSLPLTAFLLVGGVFADRLPRHLVVVVTDLVRFALHGLLAILILTGDVRIWHIVVIGMLFGTAEAFFRPASTALLPQTVPEDEIQEANAVMSATNNLAEFAGPALATALVFGVSPAAAFGLDALTFLVSAALLHRVRPRARAEPVEDAGAQSLSHDLRAGFHEVRSRAWIWATLTAFCFALFFVLAPWFVLGPIVAQDVYDSLAVYGVLSAAFGAGMVAGSVTGIRWRPRYPMRQAMRLILLWPVSIGLFAAGLSLYVVAPAIAIGGAGVGLFDVWWLTALAERVPPDKLSRVTSYDWMVSLSLLPLGYVLAGPAADALGAQNVLLGGAVIACVALALGQLPRETRALERIDDVDPVVPPLAEMPV
ncbi:MAG TPA: MFS transporter [Solirubrobacteraceae bacterium]|nr:MFS transporter [Solirubrobacteraceae bacterium]